LTRKEARFAGVFWIINGKKDASVSWRRFHIFYRMQMPVSFSYCSSKLSDGWKTPYSIEDVTATNPVSSVYLPAWF